LKIDKGVAGSREELNHERFTIGRLGPTGARNQNRRLDHAQEGVMIASTRRHSVWPAGLFLGIGMGGFVDGIVLHQIVQVHSMLSARVPLDSMENMKTNMTADGVFHAAT
jgi:hypothetical protein